MKTKILLFAIIALACLSFIVTWEIALHPSVSATVAVNQLADDESAAILMRSYDRINAFLPVTLGAVTVLFGLLLFGSDVVSAVKRALSNEEES
jgi:hypothetical protein